SAQIAADFRGELPIADDRIEAQIVLVRRLDAIAVEGGDLDLDWFGGPGIERDDLPLRRCVTQVAHGLDVGGVDTTRIASTAVVHRLPQRESLEHLLGAADVVRVIMADEKVVDVVDAEAVKKAHRLVAGLVPAVVEQNDFSTRRDENGTVSLAVGDEV